MIVIKKDNFCNFDIDPASVGEERGAEVGGGSMDILTGQRTKPFHGNSERYQNNWSMIIKETEWLYSWDRPIRRESSSFFEKGWKGKRRGC